MSDSFESFSFTEWESVLGGDPDLLTDDGQGILELKISNKLHKKKEEIELHSVDESLDEVDRALHIVTRGQAVQMFSVILNFTKLAARCPRRGWDELFPAILTSASTTTNHMEYQGALCIYLVDMVEKSPEQTLAIFQVSRQLVQNSDEDLVQCWSSVYLACVAKGLPKPLLVEIIKAVIIQGGFTQPAPCRIWCAKVLGASAAHFSSDEIVRLFLDKAMSLSQDTDLEVRACMGTQLPHLIRNVSPHVYTKRIMPEFIELVMDEELSVRQAAVVGVCASLDFLDSPCIKHWVIPTWMSLLPDLHLRSTLAREFGRFFWHCQSALNDANSQQLVSYYFDLARSQDHEIRICCMYNMPAMLKVLGPDTRLISVIEQFSTDSNYDVKFRVSTCLPVLVTLLHKTSFQLLRPTFFNLFNDVDGIFQILKNILIWEIRDVFEKGTEMNDCLFLLFRRLRDIIHRAKWHLVYKYLDQIRSFVPEFDPDQFYDICVPVLMRIISESKRPQLSELSVSIILDNVGRFRRLEQRDSICRTLVSEFAFSSEFRARLLFLKVCDIALHTYSSRFFRQYFAHAYLSLSTDAVVGVHRKMVALLPLAIAFIMSNSIPLGCSLWLADALRVSKPYDSHSSPHNSTHESLCESGRSVCSSDDILVKKAAMILETLKPLSPQLVAGLNAPPVRENAVGWDRDRERMEEQVVLEDMEDSRRKTDVPLSELRRGSGTGAADIFRDRKKLQTASKPTKQAPTKPNSSAKPAPHQTLSIGLVTPPASVNSRQHVPTNIHKGHSSEIEPGLAVPTTQQRPRLRSANSVLNGENSQSANVINESHSNSLPPHVRSVSNTALSGSHTYTNPAGLLHKATGSAAISNKMSPTSTKRPQNSLAPDSCRPICRNTDSAKRDKSVKLPALSKSGLGK